jgi:hypothetical protein
MHVLFAAALNCATDLLVQPLEVMHGPPQAFLVGLPALTVPTAMLVTVAAATLSASAFVLFVHLPQEAL